MRAIEFRYIVKFVERMKNGEPVDERILTKFFTIEEIEQSLLEDWIMYNIGAGYGTYELIARSQYTGLKDAKGNKVYEGDVLSAFNSSRENNVTGIVCFDSGTYKLKRIRQTDSAIKFGYVDFITYWDDGMHDWETMEQYQECELKIIGNVYENGELLNEQKTTNIGTDRDG